MMFSKFTPEPGMPFPGSKSARYEFGCRCPVEANANRLGPEFVLHPDCPIHAADEPDRADGKRALCPTHLRESIDAYVADGRPTGGFLRAVLENDLVGAVTRADAINIALLPHIVMYVANHVPTAATGNPQRVEAWIERCRRKREAAS